METMRLFRYLMMAALLAAGLALGACDDDNGESDPSNGICVPNCDDRECGPDGCGGTCPPGCPDDWTCDGGTCVDCVPDCAGLECGPDPVCGIECGPCQAGHVCVGGQCVPCVPDCEGRECGPDGCDSVCGTCDPGLVCTDDGQCVDPGAEPDCEGRECGPDGAGGSCGTCTPPETCQDGQCVCIPDCAGRECGSDGCGGSCGACDPGYECNAAGRCVPELDPDCFGSACMDFFGCRNACPPGPDQQQCFNECDDNLTPEALVAKNDFLDCMDSECGHCGTDDECFYDCIDTECGDEYNACFLTYACGVGDCSYWYECVSYCPDRNVDPAGAADCQELCNRQMSREGLQDLLDFQSCLSEHCPSSLSEEDWLACANAAIGDDDKCGVWAEACLGGMSDFCDPAVDDCLDCGELLACLNGCPEGAEAQACVNDCFMAASEEAYDQLMDVYDCIDVYCGELEGEAWSNCANAAIQDPAQCQAENEACFGTFEFCDPVVDNCLGCEDLLVCLNGCPEGAEAQACFNDCFEAASEEAYDALMGVYDCIDVYCGELEGEAWSNCANAAVQDPAQCQAENDACFGTFEFCDPAVEIDCLNCGELLGCLNGCDQGDQLCYNDCFAAASEEAYDALMDVYDCIDEYCGHLEGEDWTACANAAVEDPAQCEDVSDACGGGGIDFCDPAVDTCLECDELLGCVEACDDDQACSMACLEDSSEEAFNAALALETCHNDNCDHATTQEEWDTCVAAANADECEDEYLACYGNAKAALSFRSFPRVTFSKVSFPQVSPIMPRLERLPVLEEANATRRLLQRRVMLRPERNLLPIR